MQRLIDMTLAAVLGVCLLPVMALTAVVVGAYLGRPVLFRQVRSGLHGRPFTLLKFRTMRPSPPGTIIEDAARTPAVGRWLRRSRLDELPQLLNVVRGDMAFVGPRPLLPETVRAFGECGRRRGITRPGLTGWAQVNGNTRLTDKQKLALDLWYIEHRSLLCDLQLLLRTFAVVTIGERLSLSALERAHAGRRHRRS